MQFLGDREARRLPPDKVLYMMTGCQGEPRAALARAANDDHPAIKLEAGDTVIFSSKIIPGNERAIFDLINRLTRRQVDVITEEDRFVHVSGHPNRDELARMYQLLRPRIAVPVHGELRHLREHASLARDFQVGDVATVENGAMIRLAPGKPKTVDHVPHGRVAWNGRRTVPVNGTMISQRRALMSNGAAFVSVVLDRSGGLAADPAVSVLGLLEDEDPHLVENLVEDAAEAVDALSAERRHRDDDVCRDVRKALRRTLRGVFGRHPVIEIQLVRT